MPAKTEPRDVDGWDRETAAAALLRNVHPANHFYVPGGRALGEDRRLIAYAATWSKRRYELMWEDLVARSGNAAQAYLERLPAVTGQESVSSTPRREKVASVPPVGLLGTPFADDVVEYRKKRLWFMADVIEPLDWNQAFRVITPEGAYQMTKREFYEHFSNVVASSSYRVGRHYHSKAAPSKAMRFKLP